MFYLSYVSNIEIVFLHNWSFVNSNGEIIELDKVNCLWILLSTKSDENHYKDIIQQKYRKTNVGPLCSWKEVNNEMASQDLPDFSTVGNI